MNTTSDTTRSAPGGTTRYAPNDTTGTYDEALTRLHATGPERFGRLTNHAPMAVEAIAARGEAGSVHRWLDLYAAKLEEFPAAHARVTDANRAEALGDPRRAADWIAYFEQLLAERPWRDVLAEWWPRLLPGMYGGSTHPVIRVGHAVRAFLRRAARPRPGSRSWRTGSATGRPGTVRPRTSYRCRVRSPPPRPWSAYRLWTYGTEAFRTGSRA